MKRWTEEDYNKAVAEREAKEADYIRTREAVRRISIGRPFLPYLTGRFHAARPSLMAKQDRDEYKNMRCACDRCFDTLLEETNFYEEHATLSNTADLVEQ